MNRMAAALAAASFACAMGLGAAIAGPSETAYDLTFRVGTLNGFEAGDRLEYESVVVLPEGGESDGSVVSVAVEGDSVAALEEHQDGADSLRRLAEFDADVGNPLAMFFLERTIRSVAEQTGGSEFYLRNRIKDALREPEGVRDVEVEWRGQSIAGTEIVLAPFVGDPNLQQLGPFGDLRIRLVVGEDVPGWYHTLSADAGEGAFESVLSLAEVVR